MTVALTPDGKPFFGGTYFPPTPRFGMPSFKNVLLSLARAWNERRQDIIADSSRVAQYISATNEIQAGGNSFTSEMLNNAKAILAQQYDSEWGGFNDAPKFPQAMILDFLLLHYQMFHDHESLEIALITLEKMARGGIYDQVGGGFSRYSTDAQWLVPHFEKMLYDNALLSRVYLRASLISNNSFFRDIAENTLDWVIREMTHDAGGFFSSYDADSDGIEGKFYTWDSKEIKNLLDADAELFMAYYGITPRGNWEGVNILHVPRSLSDVASEFDLEVSVARAKLAAARSRLYAVREERAKPGRDGKILTAWNGLMLAALSDAARYLGRQDYLDAAIKNAEFLWENLRRNDGRLLRTWKENAPAKYDGYLEDYVFLAEGLLALYQATFDETWYRWAEEIARMTVHHFADTERIGFFDTADDHEQLIHRPRDLQDNAIPSGNGMAVTVLQKVAMYTGNQKFLKIAGDSIAAMSPMLEQHPLGFGQWLYAASLLQADPKELALIGPADQIEVQKMMKLIDSEYRPSLVVAFGDSDSEIPLLKGRTQIGGRLTAYLCRRFLCKQPVTTVSALSRQLT